MKKIIDIALSCLYFVWFWIGLLVFHVLQVLAFDVLKSRSLQKKMVDYLNLWLWLGWYFTGSRVIFVNHQKLPTDRPIIFVANHQSMFDIPPIFWYLRKHWPTFVAKKELAKYIPSISYNLRNSGAAIIDRAEGREAMVEIGRLAELITKNNHSAVIFPEGSRSRTGILKEFKIGGVAILLKKTTNALVVPIAIFGTGPANPTSFFPVKAFSKLTWTVLEPIEPNGRNAQEVLNEVEQSIRKHLGQ